jgi:hypothetical protein
MQLNYVLSIFQYYKLLGRCHFISLDQKNCYICKFIDARTQTQVKLSFAWYICESNFGEPKSS